MWWWYTDKIMDHYNSTAHGGTTCPTPTMELKECNTQACLPSAGPSAESTDNNNQNIHSIWDYFVILLLYVGIGTNFISEWQTITTTTWSGFGGNLI